MKETADWGNLWTTRLADALDIFDEAADPPKPEKEAG